MTIKDATERRSDTGFVEWRKSSFSNPNNQCVELSFTGDVVGMRDSKNPGGAVLVFDRGTWTTFRRRVEGDTQRAV